MRIIAGALGGRTFTTVEGPGYRPATAKVREAIFSMLASRGVVWGGVRVLDLFAGSGSLSFEAISRGAAEACLVEKDPHAVKCLHRNAKHLDIVDNCRIAEADVSRFLRGPAYQPYEIIFVDPPYGENRLAPTIRAVLRGNWLAPGGFLAAEVETSLRDGELPSLSEEVELDTDRTYGQTRILLWHKLPNV